MKHLILFENFLTKKYPKKNQRKKDEYLYNFGFGDIYFICLNCGSNKLKLERLYNSFSPYKYICDDCNYVSLSPRSVDPEKYNLDKKINDFNL